MRWLQKIKDRIRSNMVKMVYSDTIRQLNMFRWINFVLAIVTFMMTVLNIITKETVLAAITFIYGIMCLLNLILMKYYKKQRHLIYLIFSFETFILVTFFLITGIPNGFSALWICLIPSFALIVFGVKYGMIYSSIIFIELIILFWFPLGKHYLIYQYTNEFMLRFPFFYLACLVIDLCVETLRAKTQKLLLVSELRYKYLYCHDALTGVYNRYGFNNKIKEQYQKISFDKIGYLMLDIDNFKSINDQYGHQAGDEVLKMVVSIMKNTFCEHTIYCRWGGEEFTAFLHCQHDYLLYAEKLRQNIEKAQFNYGGHLIKVTVSIGICIAPSMNQQEFKKLEKVADECLYQAKHKGKNCVVSRII